MYILILVYFTCKRFVTSSSTGKLTIVIFYVKKLLDEAENKLCWIAHLSYLVERLPKSWLIHVIANLLNHH